MRFLVDAQLPVRLAVALSAAGHNAVHTSVLPSGNRSSDAVVAASADGEQRAVVTKDRDFRDSHFLRGTPQRLLLVSTGNIPNDRLLEVFDLHLPLIVAAFDEGSFVEVSADALIVHRDAAPPP